MRGIVLLLGCAACAKDVARFADTPVMWADDDMRHVETPVKPYWSGLAWDGADQLVFRPSQRALGVVVGGRAVNVNAFDEVPDSSWFENRLGQRSFSVDDAARGACSDVLLDATRPWTVTAAKSDGANPGFIIEGPDGRGWLLKFDRHWQPERATAADVFGSRVYYAAGFHAPCNIIVGFDPSILRLSPDTSVTQEDIENVLSAANVRPDGSLRASASLFLSGRPLGPWTYQGTKKDDPNDVVPHEDRRELRGSKLLAAWTNHFDAREQNTLAMWVQEDGRTFVKHHVIDFGDILGSVWWWVDLPLSYRFGHSYYFDATQILTDHVTLGLLDRPWDNPTFNEKAPVAYFSEVDFKPRKWKPGYPNPAFLRMDDSDGAWMARILARMDRPLVDTMLAEGELSDPVAHDEVIRILMARRDAVLDVYLRARSPLVHTRLSNDALCLEDLLTLSGRSVGGDVASTVYQPPFRNTVRTDRRSVAGGEVCIPLVDEDFAGDDPYTIVDVVLLPKEGGVLPPLRVHMARTPHGLRVLGLERPADARAPGR